MAGLRRGQVARAASVNIETLRFYEREGIIAPPPRQGSGYRAYPPETVQRIRFVKRAQELGFTLAEIRGLLELATADEGQCDAVRALAESRLALVRQKIEALSRIEGALVELIRACRQPGARLACPIIDSLVDHDAR